MGDWMASITDPNLRRVDCGNLSVPEQNTRTQEGINAAFDQIVADVRSDRIPLRPVDEGPKDQR